MLVSEAVSSARPPSTKRGVCSMSKQIKTIINAMTNGLFDVASSDDKSAANMLQ